MKPNRVFRGSWSRTNAAAKQTAFQILVASSPKLLQQGKGDLWDSGRLVSDETIGTAYAGSPLVSQEHCYWKVRVWDADGHSIWSSPAEWSMGLLQPEDWKAGWIGYDAVRLKTVLRSPFEGAQWIWFAGDAGPPPKGIRNFLKDFTLPDNIKLKHAELTATADDSFKLAVNQQVMLSSAPGTDGWRHPQTTDVTQLIRPGTNRLSGAS